MKTKFTLGLMAVVVAALTVVPVFAHHGFQSEYDAGKVVYVSGVLTKVDWENPHLYIYVEATDPDGKVADWRFEGASPNVVGRTGTRRADLVENIGKMVTIRATPAKLSPLKGAAETIKLPDGRELVVGGKRYSGNSQDTN